MNSKKIKISIIIPVYNVERYILRCIESVMSQNTVAEIECILIDDGCEDKSIDIISNSIKGYQGAIQFQILRNEHNMGVSISRNKGIQAATGEFLFFLDSDDYLTPDCIAILMKGYSEHPEAEIIIGNTEELSSHRAIYTFSEPYFIGNGLDARKWMLKEKKCFIWNRLIKRELIDKYHLYFTPAIIYEDILWTYQLYKHVSAIYILPDVTHFYEYNQTSITKLSPKRAELHVKSYTKVCIGMLKVNYENTLFIQQHLFILWAILNAIEFSNKYIIQTKTRTLLHTTRNYLMKKAVANGRAVLALYFLIMYQPFSKVMHIKMFRRYYIPISNFVERMASLFNWLH